MKPDDLEQKWIKSLIMSNRCDTGVCTADSSVVELHTAHCTAHCAVQCGRVGWEIAQGTNARVADKVGGSEQVTSN